MPLTDLFLTPVGKDLLDDVKKSKPVKYVSDRIEDYNKYLDDIKAEQDARWISMGIDPKKVDDMMEMAMVSPSIGSTRAVRELGPLVGKAENALASAIKDVSPQAEHIRNLQAIRELKNSPEVFKNFNEAHINQYPNTDAGAFKNVHIGDNNVIKKFRLEDVGKDLYPMATREQLAFDKLGTMNPNTKTYAAGDNIYQVQKKITPYEQIAKTEGEYLDRESIIKQMAKDRNIDASDMYNPSNHGELNNKIKISDAGGLYPYNNLTEEIINLRNTFKTSKENEPKLIKELFDLKKDVQPSIPKSNNKLEYYDINDSHSLDDILNNWKNNKKGYDARKTLPSGEYYHGKYNIDDLLNYKEFDRPIIPELVESIKNEGLKSPINMIATKNGKPYVGEGNHRLQALKQLGIVDVPTVFSFYKDGR